MFKTFFGPKFILSKYGKSPLYVCSISRTSHKLNKYEKRVKIPVRDVKELLDLANKVRENHMVDGDASPLKVLNWDQINTTIDDAIAVEDKALKMKRDKLKLYQQRSRRMQAVVSVMRNTRDILTGVHPDEMKALGAWGFDVLDNRTSPPAEEPQTPAKV